MATSLTSDDCNSVAEANDLFSSEKGLLVLRPRGRGPCQMSRCCSAMHFTVPSGCYALVTDHGADLDYVDEDGNASAVWPPGLHYPYPPWVGVSHLVTAQSVVLNAPVKACRTKDNVAVNIETALVFRIMGDAARGEDPSLVRKFVHEVKPRGLEQQLRDAQEEAVRALARSVRHTEIYRIRSGETTAEAAATRDEELGGYEGPGAWTTDVARRALTEQGSDDEEKEEIESEEGDPLLGASEYDALQLAQSATTKGKLAAAAMCDRLNRQFVPQGVQILSVAIKKITLPDDIVFQMSERTMVVSQTAQQLMQHEYDMQKERMEQEVQTITQAFQERREQEATEGKTAMNIERVKLNDAVSQAKKAEAELREDAKMKVKTIRAGNDLVIQRIRDIIFKETSRIESDARKHCAELRATTLVEAQSVVAEAELKAAENRANAQKIISEAEGQMTPWLHQQREHKTQLKHLKVYEQLAENDGLILGGSDDDAENVATVADAILRGKYRGSGRSSGRNSFLAELALLNMASPAVVSPSNED